MTNETEKLSLGTTLGNHLYEQIKPLFESRYFGEIRDFMYVQFRKIPTSEAPYHNPNTHIITVLTAARYLAGNDFPKQLNTVLEEILFWHDYDHPGVPYRQLAKDNELPHYSSEEWAVFCMVRSMLPEHEVEVYKKITDNICNRCIEGADLLKFSDIQKDTKDAKLDNRVQWLDFVGRHILMTSFGQHNSDSLKSLFSDAGEEYHREYATQIDKYGHIAALVALTDVSAGLLCKDFESWMRESFLLLSETKAANMPLPKDLNEWVQKQRGFMQFGILPAIKRFERYVGVSDDRVIHLNSRYSQFERLLDKIDSTSKTYNPEMAQKYEKLLETQHSSVP